MLRWVNGFVGRYLPSRVADVLRVIGGTVLQRPFATGHMALVRSSLSALLKTDRSLGMPVHVTIEPTNFCNLKCPVCETGSGILRREGRRMSLPEFKELMCYLGDNVNILFLYWMGEPFMNPEVYDMARFARAAGIYVETCTNGEMVDERALDGFNAVSYQIGGMMVETHQGYRVNGDVHKTINGLIAAATWAKQTEVSAGFIVMRHNEHEVDRFVSFCERLGVKGDVISPCVRTVEQALDYLPRNGRYWLYDAEELWERRLVPKVRPHNSCPWIYYSTVVAADGTVYPCCRDAHGDHPMGNLHDQDMATIWNGKRYRDFRRRIARDQASVEICRLCSGYGIPLLKRRAGTLQARKS